MKRLINLVAGLLLFFSVHAQDFTQTIKGRIIDQQSGASIIGASVVVLNSTPTIGGVTDVNGYFRIQHVAVGRHSLAISSIGYEGKTLPNIMVSTGKEVVLEVELTEALVEMEAIEVVANNQEKGQPLNDMATVSAISLSVEELGRYAATFDDPARAALSQAGVTTGGDDLLNEIVIRGNSPKGMLWRLEGVEIPNPNHFGSIGSSAGGISMLSSNVLSNSDFFTGAFPAQYGNVTSGIFDLNMRKGNFDQHEHSFQAGLLGLALASEGPIGSNSNSSYLVNYRYSTLALFDKIGLNILGDQEDVTFQDLSFKVHLATKKSGSFSIWGLGGNNTYTYIPDPVFDEPYSDSNVHNMGAVGVTHVAYLSPNTYLESIVSLTGYNLNYQFDTLNVRTLETEDIAETTTRISSYINHKFNAKNTLRVGGIVSRINFNLKSTEWIKKDSSYVFVLDDRDHTYFIQGFGQWQHRATQNLTINSGVHISHFLLNGNTYLEPRLGYRYKLADGSTFTGGFGLHSRMESLALYMARDVFEGGGDKAYNRDLGFTRAAHGVVGYEKMLGKNLRFKTEVYYQYLYDVPVWGNDTTTNAGERSFSALNTYDGYTSFPLANNGTGKNYGVEFTLDKFFANNHYFMVTTSLYESKYAGVDGVERDTRFNGNYIFNFVGGKEFQLGSPQRTLNVNVRMIYAGGKREAPIDVEASRNEGYTVRDFTRNFESRLEDYKRLDLGVSYKKNKTKTAYTISVNVQNVLGIENVYSQYYIPKQDAIFSATQLGVFPNLSYKLDF
ncbi:MAG: TonB-dependent receptor [Cyclobacteriaceae bacterium]|nr:TonB-dependent receptor [Cyclobacteriaceae bacterium SS2]